MDFIDGLPKLDNFSAILVVVDRLSKYAHFITLKHPYTTLTATAFFLKKPCVDTVYLRALCLIETKYSPVYFGRSYFV